jgi:hypothetical protein
MPLKFIPLILLATNGMFGQLVTYNFNDTSDSDAILTASTLDVNFTASLFAISDSDGKFTSVNTTGPLGTGDNAVRDQGGWATTDASKYSFLR